MTPSPRHLIVVLVLTMVCASVIVLAQAPSSPIQGTIGEVMPPESSGTISQVPPDVRGTPGSPVVVEVLPAPKPPEEAAEERARAADQSDASWWMVRLGALVITVLMIQLLVSGLQASRLRETIEKVVQNTSAQADDTRMSIAQLTRASTAMEDMSQSMRASVESIKDHLSISRQIADSQMQAIVLQNRAYLEIADWKVFKLVDDVSPEPGRRVDPRDAHVTYFIGNKGQTAAILHRVTHTIPTANVFRTHELDVVLQAGQRLQQGISFKLPESHEAQLGFLGETFTVDVEVHYSDGFATRTKRCGRELHQSGWAFGDKDEEQHWLVCGGTEWNREVENLDPEREA